MWLWSEPSRSRCSLSMTSQSELELRKAEEMCKNYVAQGKLVISLTKAKEKADEKIGLLETANSGLLK